MNKRIKPGAPGARPVGSDEAMREPGARRRPKCVVAEAAGEQNEQRVAAGKRGGAGY